MALAEVRIANESGRAVVVLAPDLTDILFANTFARRLFAAPGTDDGDLSLSLRQLRVVAPVLQEDGEAMLRMKSTAEGLEVWVTAHVLTSHDAQGSPIAILTAPVPGARRERRAELAERLLREAGSRDAAIFDAAAPVLAHPSFEPGSAEAKAAASIAARLIESDEGRAEEGRYGLWRVASDLVLVEMGEEPAPAATPEPPAAEGNDIAALIERLRGRGAAQLSAAARQSAEEPSPPQAPAEQDAAAKPAAAFDSRFAGEPVRFVWQTDGEGRFKQLSPEFAEIVGPAAADVCGLAFADVAEAFGFDEEGEIGALMERRDTFAGRTVFWPVEGTDRKVSVDLAALPTYGRERVFEGFRGFGIVRPAEHVEDPLAIGLALGREKEAVRDQRSAAAAPAAAPEAGASFGQRSARPEPRPEPAGSGVVVSLRERRRDGHLSDAEADAFKAIGVELAPRDRATEAPEGASPPLDAGLEAFLAALPAALLVETKGRLVLASHAFLEMTGYGGLEDLIEAGGLEALFDDTARPGEGEETVRLRRADGTLLDARVQIRRVALAGRSSIAFSFAQASPPVRDAMSGDAGEIARLTGEVEELRSVLDTATDGIVLTDPNGLVRSMNGSAQSLLGVDADGYAGRRFTDFLAPASRAVATGYLESLRDEGLAAILNDGREVTAEVADRGTIPLFITIGRLSGERGWCVLLRDIANWKAAEAELVAARKQAEDASLTKSRFLANISHELRTPLNAIIGFADVMTAETYGPVGHERYMEYLRDIKRSGHHVLDLVNDLLDISKIEAGKVELSFEAVSLNEIVGEIVSLMQPQANRERVLVRSTLAQAVPPVVADRRTLRQIALNLISNAIRFTPAGGQIVASTGYDEDGSVTLRFRDSGIGMTETEIEIALTPFQQVNSAAKERGDGTGLGLPLTKALVEANKAQFHIDSIPGEGTMIEITFPAQRVLAH